MRFRDKSIQDNHVMHGHITYCDYLPLERCILLVIAASLSFAMYGCTKSPTLKWNEGDGYRWADINPGFFGDTGFKQLDPGRTGVDFRNDISEEEIGRNRHYLNGSGVAAGDINDDGLVDLYFSGLGSSNKLYQNLGGMRFKDITEEAGVGHGGYYSTGVVFADVNADGHLDILVSSMHKGVSLYVNDGKGKFELEEDSGLESSGGGITMTLADIDDDEYIDLYVTKYKEKSVKDIYTTQELAWENVINEPLIDPTDTYTLSSPFDQHYAILTQNGEFAGIYEVGEQDELYLNKGGKFERVHNTKEIFLDEEGAPFGLQPDWGLTAKFQDLNDNGLPDLYVCNDFETPDRVWMNQGDGTFKAIPWFAIRNFSFSCMAVDFSDINRDGMLDIFTTEMLSPEHHRRLSQVGADDPVTIQIGDVKARPMYNRNSMYLQREDGTYAEISNLSGVEATGWSWATRFMDIDLDGYEDLIVATGYPYDILDIDAQMEMVRERRNMDEHYLDFLGKTKPLHLPNRILRNNGDLTFANRESEWGMPEEDVSHGMVLADLNNNGVQDIVVNRMNREAAIYENTTNAPRIAVRLKGQAPNTQAIGATVELDGGPVAQEKEVTAGGEYASGSDLMVVFAASPDNAEHSITITWPGEYQSRVDSVRANRIYEISEPSNRTSSNCERKKASKEAEGAMFEDISSYINHNHHENDFDDFRFSPLAPIRLSRLGPGVAWIDYNKTGYDDLFIASGKGGQLSAFENQGEDGVNFSSLSLDAMAQEAVGDQASILGWSESGYTKIIVAVSSYETPDYDKSPVYMYVIDRDGNVEGDGVLSVSSSVGPMAVSDANKNGHLDLFVGGRAISGRYPEDADSRLFINEEGAYSEDKGNSDLFSRVGNITGAIFDDFTGNGYQDLLVSSEWGNLRLFGNEGGDFAEITDEVGLGDYSGWWNGVATGDFNNNGLIDIVTTNMGLNSQWKSDREMPIRMYFGDLSRNGRIDIIEAYPDSRGNYLPRRKMYEFQEARIRLNRMGSHEEFANSTVDEILGGHSSHVRYKEVNTLEHVIFINTGEGQFEAHPLPLEAQFSTAFDASVADFNNDGNEDIFLSQNLFAVPDNVPRMDAGRGLILEGDGAGNFTPIPGSRSGIKVYGEQRGAAVSDINRDGKTDLAVSQNGAETRLFLNRTEKVGYSITLVGPPENQDSIGSSIRLIYANGEKGPRRSVQSGSGYWSQSSFTQIMGAAAPSVQAIQVTWFDGERQNVPVTEGKKNYTIVHPSVD